MSERSDFQPLPRESSLTDICDAAFEKGLAGEGDFVVSTSSEPLGLVYEQVSYITPYGDSDVSVRMVRPTLDAAEFLTHAEGTIDEKPKAEVWVQAPRGFLFNLMNGEKYFADKGFFRIVVLSDGTYIDIFSIAFSTTTGEDGSVQTLPDTVGSMLRPIPPETDWAIQDIIDPNRTD